MKAKLLIFFLLLTSQLLLAKPDIQFLSPIPDSKHIKTTSSIILRFESKLDLNSLNSSLIKVAGTKSGSHDCKIDISSDASTIIFTPQNKFHLDEKVTVKINPVKTDAGFSAPVNFSFETEKENIKFSAEKFLRDELKTADNDYNQSSPGPFNKSNTLPADFPQITVTNSTNPGPGYIFLSNFSITANVPSYLMILDNTGYPVYYKKLDTAAYDFKKQPNGNLTYFSARGQKFYMMNPQYQIIDSFACGNGYPTDLHELQILPNGHSLLMSYDPQVVNMAAVINGGLPNAIVVGLVIQELDVNKNVIFQWRSWDHFDILDATHTNFRDTVIDYVHGNAIDVANDGNLLISSRHLDEITKISRSTGNIIWRLGGKKNQFFFINETISFSHQHAIRQLPNGNITLFDNGNYSGPINNTRGNKFQVSVSEDNLPVFISRAVEYNINEANHTATLVWQYINNPIVYGAAMGYMERLPNGNSIIGWGLTNPTFTEVNAAGQKVFELSLPNGQVSYRAFKSDWTPVPFETPTTYQLYQNYPNPFNPGTTIRFDLSAQSDVKFTVFNILGQTVREEVRSNLLPGIYNFNFDGSNLAAGVYFYRIKTNSFTETKKMMLVK